MPAMPFHGRDADVVDVYGDSVFRGTYADFARLRLLRMEAY